MTSETNQTQETQDRLYAGKFKSVEDLENGYKNAETFIGENSTLKQKIADIEKSNAIPEDYSLGDLTIDENSAVELKEMAKKAGLSQPKFEALAKAAIERTEAYQQKLESTKAAAKESLGSELIKIETHLKSTVPEEIKNQIMETILTNETARVALLNKVNESLNSSVNGMNMGDGNALQKPSAESIREAARLAERNPGNLQYREEYLNLLARK